MGQLTSSLKAAHMCIAQLQSMREPSTLGRNFSSDVKQPIYLQHLTTKICKSAILNCMSVGQKKTLLHVTVFLSKFVATLNQLLLTIKVSSLLPATVIRTLV